MCQPSPRRRGEQTYTFQVSRYELFTTRLSFDEWSVAQNEPLVTCGAIPRKFPGGRGCRVFTENFLRWSGSGLFREISLEVGVSVFPRNFPGGRDLGLGL